MVSSALRRIVSLCSVSTGRFSNSGLQTMSGRFSKLGWQPKSDLDPPCVQTSRGTQTGYDWPCRTLRRSGSSASCQPCPSGTDIAGSNRGSSVPGSCGMSEALSARSSQATYLRPGLRVLSTTPRMRRRYHQVDT